jgi:hypothetical protein
MLPARGALPIAAIATTCHTKVVIRLLFIFCLLLALVVFLVIVVVVIVVVFFTEVVCDLV